MEAINTPTEVLFAVLLWIGNPLSKLLAVKSVAFALHIAHSLVQFRRHIPIRRQRHWTHRVIEMPQCFHSRRKVLHATKEMPFNWVETKENEGRHNDRLRGTWRLTFTKLQWFYVLIYALRKWSEKKTTKEQFWNHFRLSGLSNWSASIKVSLLRKTIWGNFHFLKHFLNCLPKEK